MISAAVFLAIACALSNFLFTHRNTVDAVKFVFAQLATMTNDRQEVYIDADLARTEEGAASCAANGH